MFLSRVLWSSSTVYKPINFTQNKSWKNHKSYLERQSQIDRQSKTAPVTKDDSPVIIHTPIGNIASYDHTGKYVGKYKRSGNNFSARKKRGSTFGALNPEVKNLGNFSNLRQQDVQIKSQNAQNSMNCDDFFRGQEVASDRQANRHRSRRFGESLNVHLEDCEDFHEQKFPRSNGRSHQPQTHEYRYLHKDGAHEDKRMQQDTFPQSLSSRNDVKRGDDNECDDFSNKNSRRYDKVFSTANHEGVRKLQTFQSKYSLKLLSGIPDCSAEFLFGVFPVTLALEAKKRKIYKIFCKSGLQDRIPGIKNIIKIARERNISIEFIDTAMFRKVFRDITVHQGVFCVTSPLPVRVISSEEVEVLSALQNSEASVSKNSYVESGFQAELNKSIGNAVIDFEASSSKYQLMNGLRDLSSESTISNTSFVGLEDEPSLKSSSSILSNSDTASESMCEQTKQVFTKSGSSTSDSNISRPRLWVLIDRIVDSMNLGAVLRSCCYFGVEHVLLTPSGSPIDPIVSKASSGAAELLNITLLSQPTETLTRLQRIGWRILVTVTKDYNSLRTDDCMGQSCTPETYDVCDATRAESEKIGSKVLRVTTLSEFSLLQDTILVIGHEGSGISSSILQQADEAVIIPGIGASSQALGCLNVSAATAICVHWLMNTLTQKSKKINETSPYPSLPPRSLESSALQRRTNYFRIISQF